MEPVKKAVDQSGFASPDFTGEGDKPLTGLDTVHQTRQGLFDLRRQEQKARIGIDVEGALFKAEKALVHNLGSLVLIPSDYSTCDSTSMRCRGHLGFSLRKPAELLGQNERAWVPLETDSYDLISIGGATTRARTASLANAGNIGSVR
jgi:hypothetical protein